MLPEPSTFLLFAAASLAMLVTPGPAVLYIVARSVDEGRRAGLVSMLGVHAGTLVHVAAAAAGVSALLAASAGAFAVVKYAGAAYLVYLGVRRLGLRVPVPAAAPGPAAGRALRRAFVDGVVVNVFNPKTALFFLAFLPQFVDPARGQAAAQVLLLGALFVALGICTDGGYALAASAAGRWLRGHPRVAAGERWLSGGLYVGLGVAAAVSRHHRA